MRIGIDCRLWNETGVGRYVRNLVRYLGEIDKHNDYVLFARKGDIESIKYYVSSIKWKLVEANIRWHTVDEQMRLPAILTKEKLDLVHFPYFSVPIFYSGRFVITIHDLIINQLDTGKASTLPLPLYKVKRLGYKTVLAKAVKKASKIIAVSQATKQDIIKYLQVDPDKIVVTYEGVDAALNSKLSAKGRSASDGKIQKVFLYVGNAYPHKNLDRLIAAFNLLMQSRQRRDKIQNVKLILVGKEDYFYKKLKTRVEAMGIENNVVFKGAVTDQELTVLYQNAKALIMPSLVEGFGLPALEAMANSCLILVSDIASLRETCGEAAVYFNPHDGEDMKEKMSLVLDHEFKEKVGQGVKRAKLFSWKKMAQQTLKVYEEVV